MSLWILRQPELALTEREVAVGRRHQHARHAARRERVAIDGVAHADRTLPIKPLGEGGGEEFANMDDQKNRQRESVGQAAQNLDERRWSARGDANGDGAQTPRILQRLGLLRAMRGGLGVCPMRPSRARGWVMTLMREMSLTVATSFFSHTSSSSFPFGLSSASSAPAARAS